MSYKKNKFYSKEEKEKKQNDYDRKVADIFIKALSEGKAPWNKPWNPITDKMDYNMFTMNEKKSFKEYQGYNQIITYLTRKIDFDSEDPRWMTMGELINYNKKKFGENKQDYYCIKQGEKATQINYYSPLYLDENNKKLDPSKMSKEEFKNKLAKTSFILTSSFIFNVSQTAQYEYDENGKLKKDENGKLIYKPNSSIPYEFTKEEIEETQKSFDNKKEIEKFIKELEITFKNDSPSKSFYDPMNDSIHLPPKETFKNPEEYYQTAFHEIIHWAGDKRRLDRTEAEQYSKDKKMRAKEELVAEIGGYMMCQKLKMKYEPSDNNKEYVKSWCSIIDEKPDAIKDACNKASKAVSYVIKLHDEKIHQEQNINIVVTEKKESKGKGRT